MGDGIDSEVCVGLSLGRGEVSLLPESCSQGPPRHCRACCCEPCWECGQIRCRPTFESGSRRELGDVGPPRTSGRSHSDKVKCALLEWIRPHRRPAIGPKVALKKVSRGCSAWDPS